MMTRTKILVSTAIACTVVLFIVLVGFAIRYEMNQPSYSCLSSHTVEVHEPARTEWKHKSQALGEFGIPAGGDFVWVHYPERNYTKTVCDEWSPATPAR